MSDGERGWDLGGLGTFPQFDPGEIGTVWVCLVEQHTQWLRGKTFMVWGGAHMIGAPRFHPAPVLGICPPSVVVKRAPLSEHSWGPVVSSLLQ